MKQTTEPTDKTCGFEGTEDWKCDLLGYDTLYSGRLVPALWRNLRPSLCLVKLNPENGDSLFLQRISMHLHCHNPKLQYRVGVE
jgi:hypothetical protein